RYPYRTPHPFSPGGELQLGETAPDLFAELIAYLGSRFPGAGTTPMTRPAGFARDDPEPRSRPVEPSPSRLVRATTQHTIPFQGRIACLGLVSGPPRPSFW